MLFKDEDEQIDAMSTINFYNKVKEVIIRCGGVDKVINLKIFSGLIKEMRIKLDITKAGLGAEKTMRAIENGLDIIVDGSDDSNSAEVERQRRIEEIILKEFNMINITCVQIALL